MADKKVIKTPTITLGGTDLSDFLSELEIQAEIEEQESTAARDSARTAEPGLENNRLRLTFREGADMSALDGVLWPLRGTKVTFEALFENAAVSASNPKYSGTVLIAGNYNIGGTVGEQMTRQLDLRITTVVTRATA